MTIFKSRAKRRTTFDTWQCHVLLNDGRKETIKKADGFCADPFLLREDIVLFEYYCFKESRGWIEACHLGTGKTYKVFDNGVHSSFPFLFSVDGVDYVMPEQRELSLLEAMPISYGRDGSVSVAEGRSIKLCAGVPIVDAMLLVHQGRLFCLYNEDVGLIGDPGGTLMLAGMRLEPQGLDIKDAIVLSSDFRTARNGGSAWSRRGAFYRVFQRKEAAGYGNGIGVERIRLDLDGAVAEVRSDLICPPFFKAKGLDKVSHHLDIKPYGRVWDARPRKV